MIRRHRTLLRLWPDGAVLVAALLTCALSAAVPNASADDAEEPRLPTIVNAPGEWSDEENRPGPIAAVGLATRRIPVGILGERGDLAAFATSALDGSSFWLDLPGFSRERSGLVDGVALSPDGRWLGWVRVGKGQTIRGWSIKDTTTGKVRKIHVKGYDRDRVDISDVAFSGDSRYLLTTYEKPGKPQKGRSNYSFVAWSVEDGTPTVLNEPGSTALPNIGNADQGVVWSQGHDVHRVDPNTGRRSAVRLPRIVHLASWAPNDAAFAYIGRSDREKGEPAPDEHLYVGATATTAHRMVNLPKTSPIGEALAWRDATHVVVGNYRGDMYEVDITDGSYETIAMAGAGEQLNTPLLATALWANPLREPVAPIGTTDPRRPWRWTGVGLFLVLVGGGAVLLRHTDRAAKAGRRHLDLQEQQ